MNLSIVTTLYRSAPYLAEFYTRVSAVAKKLTSDFEIVLINDGSPDNSLEVALSICQQNSSVRVIDLSRNFGHHRAMMTGLSHARGDLVFLIDSDLEEEPELLELFLQELTTRDADVVFGVQEKRKGRLFERISGAIFFKLFNLLSTHSLPPNMMTASLMTRKYVSALVQHREREMILMGLQVATGFKQVTLPIKKRHKSSSTYNVRRKVSLLVNAITSFSSKPLVFIFYLGCFILVISGIAAIDLIVRKLVFGTLLEGWASLIVSIWLLGGMSIFCMGVIAIYLSKIFIEVKQRPYTIIKDVYQRAEHSLDVSNPISNGQPFEATEQETDSHKMVGVEQEY